jgi:hypothetical protein
MVMNNPSPGYDTPPFEWSATPAGSFSGNNYAANGAADGLDPYFVWTDLGGFAHLRKPGQAEPDSHVPKWLPMLIELAEGVQASALVTPERQQALFIPPAYTNDYTDIAQGGVVPALINRSFFALVRQDPQLASLIQRVELDIPQEALLATTTGKQAQRAVAQSMSMAQQASARPLAKKVIAFIDDGCAFAQPSFWRGSPALPASFAPRVKRLWDMNRRSPASAQLAPVAFQAMEVAGEYGREFTDVDLKAMVLARTYNGRVDEDAVYADFAEGTQGKVNRLRGRSAHGTHVMDLGCGPYFVEDTICSRHNAEPANLGGGARRGLRCGHYFCATAYGHGAKYLGARHHDGRCDQRLYLHHQPVPTRCADCGERQLGRTGRVACWQQRAGALYGQADHHAARVVPV